MARAQLLCTDKDGRYLCGGYASWGDVTHAAKTWNDDKSYDGRVCKDVCNKRDEQPLDTALFDRRFHTHKQLCFDKKLCGST